MDPIPDPRGVESWPQMGKRLRSCIPRKELGSFLGGRDDLKIIGFELGNRR